VHLSLPIDQEATEMEKCDEEIFLSTVGLIALGIAAPASAADLAPYTKAPPAPVVAVYDGAASTSAPTAAAAGATNAGMSRASVDLSPPSVKVVTMRPAEWLAVRLDTVGRERVGCSVWKRRATGLI
jgi:hypothetical protein